MTEPVLGSYYKITYIGESLSKPQSCQTEGMYVGTHASFHVFAVVVPSPMTNTVIQTISLIYTNELYIPVSFPSNKILINSTTKYCLTEYIRSKSYRPPLPNSRTSPIKILVPETLLTHVD